MGYIVSAKGVSVQAGKIYAIKKWPQPCNLTELQQFLGLYNYYRHFICQYAIVTVPLTDILWQKGSFTFGIEQERAFQKLKDALPQVPVLASFDPALPKRVLADTLGLTSGAILEQQIDGYWHSVKYFSKQLSEVESSWPATELDIRHRYYQPIQLYDIHDYFDII